MSNQLVSFLGRANLVSSSLDISKPSWAFVKNWTEVVSKSRNPKTHQATRKFGNAETAMKQRSHRKWRTKGSKIFLVLIIITRQKNFTSLTYSVLAGSTVFAEPCLIENSSLTQAWPKRNWIWIKFPQWS